jgi:hypothetical protein
MRCDPKGAQCKARGAWSKLATGSAAEVPFRGATRPRAGTDVPVGQPKIGDENCEVNNDELLPARLLMERNGYRLPSSSVRRANF